MSTYKYGQPLYRVHVAPHGALQVDPKGVINSINEDYTRTSSGSMCATKSLFNPEKQELPMPVEVAVQIHPMIMVYCNEENLGAASKFVIQKWNNTMESRKQKLQAMLETIHFIEV